MNAGLAPTLYLDAVPAREKPPANERDRVNRNGHPATLGPPAKPGNGLAVTHGSYSLVKLGARAENLANEIAELVPAGDACDQFAIGPRAPLARCCGLNEDPRARELARLEQDARGWSNSAMRAMESLGLTPLARARLSDAIRPNLGGQRSGLFGRAVVPRPPARPPFYPQRKKLFMGEIPAKPLPKGSLQG
jgi:hypothetical protein